MITHPHVSSTSTLSFSGTGTATLTGTGTGLPSPTKAADSGTSGGSLATAGIVVGSVVVAAAIGIWVFRKWKLSVSYLLIVFVCYCIFIGDFATKKRNKQLTFSFLSKRA